MMRKSAKMFGILSIAAAAACPAFAAEKITVDNFIRAESDLYFSNVVKDGGFGSRATVFAGFMRVCASFILRHHPVFREQMSGIPSPREECRSIHRSESTLSRYRSLFDFGGSGNGGLHVRAEGG